MITTKFPPDCKFLSLLILPFYYAAIFQRRGYRGTANERLVAITKVKTRESRLELHG